jgi:hypothetical protein
VFWLSGGAPSLRPLQARLHPPSLLHTSMRKLRRVKLNIILSYMPKVLKMLMFFFTFKYILGQFLVFILVYKSPARKSETGQKGSKGFDRMTDFLKSSV